MIAKRAVVEDIRRISADTVAIVLYFEQGRFAEASLRANFVLAGARRAGFRGIRDAAAALKLALRRPDRETINAVDSGLATLVEEVERVSRALDPMIGRP